MQTTPLAFPIEDIAVSPTRALRRVTPVGVEASEDNVTGVAGIALFGELLDRLGLVEVADRHHLRPIGPGGYSGGECYRAVVETQLAGGDFLADVSLLRDEATQRLRGSHALPSHTTLFRFLAGSDLGRVKRAQATNTDLLERAWAMGAAPLPGRLTIDPDATYIDTYGKHKEGSRFSYKGEVQMSPLVGVIGETGDVLAVRARGGNASPRRKLASFIDECVAAVPRSARDRYELWIRIDSAGFSKAVVNRAISHKATFTITAEQTEPVRAAIAQLAMDEATIWRSAQNADGELVPEGRQRARSNARGTAGASCARCARGRRRRVPWRPRGSPPRSARALPHRPSRCYPACGGGRSPGGARRSCCIGGRTGGGRRPRARPRPHGPGGGSCRRRSSSRRSPHTCDAARERSGRAPRTERPRAGTAT